MWQLVSVFSTITSKVSSVCFLCWHVPLDNKGFRVSQYTASEGVACCGLLLCAKIFYD